jgi:hypothetical protein
MDEMLARALLMAVIVGAASAGAPRAQAQSAPLPRTADGKADLSGSWQVRNRASDDLELHVARDGMPAGEGVVVGDEIPYLPAALEQKRKNFAARATEDPFRVLSARRAADHVTSSAVPDLPQTPGAPAITFEWSAVYRLIYTNGQPIARGHRVVMGDRAGRQKRDALVVEGHGHERSHLARRASGNFHSEALKSGATSCATRTPSTTRPTLDDPKVFARPWKIAR